MELSEENRQTLLLVITLLAMIVFFSSFLLFVCAAYVKITIDARMALIETYNSDVLPGIFLFVGILNLVQNVSCMIVCLKLRNPRKRRELMPTLLPILIGGMVLVLFEFSSAITSFVHISILDSEFGQGLDKAMTEYIKGKELKIEMDTVQAEYRCCGDLSYVDWFTHAWIDPHYLTVPTGSEKKYLAKDGKYYSDDTPFSCCDPNAPRPCIHHHIHDNRRHHNYNYKMETTLHVRGCRKVLMNVYGTILLTVGLIAMVIAAVKTSVLLLFRLMQTSISKAKQLGNWTATTQAYIYFERIDDDVKTKEGKEKGGKGGKDAGDESDKEGSAMTSSGDEGGTTSSGDEGLTASSGDEDVTASSGDQKGAVGGITSSGDEGATTASGDEGLAASSDDQKRALAGATADAEGATTPAVDQGDLGVVAPSSGKRATSPSGDKGVTTSSDSLKKSPIAPSDDQKSAEDVAAPSEDQMADDEASASSGEEGAIASSGEKEISGKETEDMDSSDDFEKKKSSTVQFDLKQNRTFSHQDSGNTTASLEQPDSEGENTNNIVGNANNNLWKPLNFRQRITPNKSYNQHMNLHGWKRGRNQDVTHGRQEQNARDMGNSRSRTFAKQIPGTRYNEYDDDADNDDDYSGDVEHHNHNRSSAASKGSKKPDMFEAKSQRAKRNPKLAEHQRESNRSERLNPASSGKQARGSWSRVSQKREPRNAGGPGLLVALKARLSGKGSSQRDKRRNFTGNYKYSLLTTISDEDENDDDDSTNHFKEKNDNDPFPVCPAQESAIVDRQVDVEADLISFEDLDESNKDTTTETSFNSAASPMPVKTETDVVLSWPERMRPNRRLDKHKRLSSIKTGNAKVHSTVSDDASSFEDDQALETTTSSSDSSSTLTESKLAEYHEEYENTEGTKHTKMRNQKARDNYLGQVRFKHDDRVATTRKVSLSSDSKASCHEPRSSNSEANCISAAAEGTHVSCAQKRQGSNTEATQDSHVHKTSDLRADKTSSSSTEETQGSSTGSSTEETQGSSTGSTEETQASSTDVTPIVDISNQQVSSFHTLPVEPAVSRSHHDKGMIQRYTKIPPAGGVKADVKSYKKETVRPSAIVAPSFYSSPQQHAASSSSSTFHDHGWGGVAPQQGSSISYQEYDSENVQYRTDSRGRTEREYSQVQPHHIHASTLLINPQRRLPGRSTPYPYETMGSERRKNDDNYVLSLRRQRCYTPYNHPAVISNNNMSIEDNSELTTDIPESETDVSNIHSPLQGPRLRQSFSQTSSVASQHFLQTSHGQQQQQPLNMQQMHQMQQQEQPYRQPWVSTAASTTAEVANALAQTCTDLSRIDSDSSSQSGVSPDVAMSKEVARPMTKPPLNLTNKPPSQPTLQLSPSGRNHIRSYHKRNIYRVSPFLSSNTSSPSTVRSPPCHLLSSASPLLEVPIETSTPVFPGNRGAGLAAAVALDTNTINATISDPEMLDRQSMKQATSFYGATSGPVQTITTAVTGSSSCAELQGPPARLSNENCQPVTHERDGHSWHLNNTSSRKSSENLGGNSPGGENSTENQALIDSALPPPQLPVSKSDGSLARNRVLISPFY